MGDTRPADTLALISLLYRRNEPTEALALIEKDKPGNAKKVLRTAIRGFPAGVRPRELLFGISYREKDDACAEAALKGALRLLPNNIGLQRELAAVRQAQRKAWAAKNSWLDAGRR